MGRFLVNLVSFMVGGYILVLIAFVSGLVAVFGVSMGLGMFFDGAWRDACLILVVGVAGALACVGAWELTERLADRLVRQALRRR